MNYSLATLSSQPNRIWTAFCALVNPFVTTSVAINIYHHKGMCIEHRRIHLFTAGFNILFCFYTVRVWCWLIILKIKIRMYFKIFILYCIVWLNWLRSNIYPDTHFKMIRVYINCQIIDERYYNYNFYILLLGGLRT